MNIILALGWLREEELQDSWVTTRHSEKNKNIMFLVQS